MSTNEPDNTTIQEMRDHIKTLETDLSKLRKDNELLPSLQETVTAKEAEIETLRGQLEATNPNAERITQYEEVLNDLYEQELASVPDDRKEQVKLLSSSGSLPDRIKQVKAAKALISANVPAVAPVTPHTPVGGGGGAAPLTTATSTAATGPFQPPGWSQVLKPAGTSQQV